MFVSTAIRSRFMEEIRCYINQFSCLHTDDHVLITGTVASLIMFVSSE